MIETNRIEINKLGYVNDDSLHKSIQSANSLFNFMRKTEYLKLILKNKAFIPRYYEEIIDYLNLSKITKIAFPMTCFCDIHVQKISSHCSNYGSIGIGMSKVWGINSGIQPIHYINSNSRIIKELQELFKFDEDESNLEIVDKYKNYLLEHVIFIKPLQGKMYRNGQYVSANFHDEREWRYIPNITEDIDLPEVISQDMFMNQTAYNSFSKGILTHENLWLRFEYSDIRYLFLQNDEDRDEIIDFINNDLDISMKEKFILISKIVVLDSIGEDL